MPNCKQCEGKYSSLSWTIRDDGLCKSCGDKADENAKNEAERKKESIKADEVNMTNNSNKSASQKKKYSFIALAALFCITIYCYVVYQKKSNTTVIEGTIKRTMIIGFTSNRNQMQADPPSEQLIASDGTTYTLRQMPNCIVNDKTSDPDVIQLGAVGKYRCKGNLNGKVFEAYEITRLD